MLDRVVRAAPVGQDLAEVVDHRRLAHEVARHGGWQLRLRSYESSARSQSPAK